MMKTKSKALAAIVSKCDLCHDRKGRNATIVHHLKFTDEDNFIGHLKEHYSDEYAIEWLGNWWRFVRRFYGQAAHEKYQPLWLVYLELTGARVLNRDKAIYAHRGMVEQ